MKDVWKEKIVSLELNFGYFFPLKLSISKHFHNIISFLFSLQVRGFCTFWLCTFSLSRRYSRHKIGTALQQARYHTMYKEMLFSGCGSCVLSPILSSHHKWVFIKSIITAGPFPGRLHTVSSGRHPNYSISTLNLIVIYWPLSPLTLYWHSQSLKWWLPSHNISQRIIAT